MITQIAHDFDFDPTHGYTVEKLLQVGAPEEPEDFEAFWRRTYKSAMAINLAITEKSIESPHPNYSLYRVEYNSLGNVRIGAWLSVPKSGAIKKLVVMGHGYGGRDEPVFDGPVNEAAYIFPTVRGFQLSPHPDYPGNGHEHVMVGLESKESYSHRGSVVDYWLAASVLIQRFPEAAENLYYIGGSFGGGIGSLMLPWDARFKKAYLNIPSFGNHPLRVTLPCVGSGQAIQAHYQNGHPEILETLAYFDAAIAATYIKIPVFVAAALFDPAVPPPGQFAVYNSLAGPKSLFIREADHFEIDSRELDNAAIHSRLVRWFQ